MCVLLVQGQHEPAALTELARESDLAAQKRAERKFRGLLESAPDAMLIVDHRSEINLVNAATETLFGYPREKLIGRPVELLMPEPYPARHPAQRDGFFAEPRTRPMRAELDLWARRKDGSEFPVEISLSPLSSEEVVLTTAAVRDISDRRRAEADLRATNARMEAANRAKDNFLARMSHELRTPLDAILGFAGTLLLELPGALNEEQAKQVLTGEASGRHLRSIISNLFDLSRLEAGEVELRREPVELRGLVDEVASGLRPIAADKGLELEVGPSEGECQVLSDRDALAQIAANLIENAIRFTERGRIRVQVRALCRNGSPWQELSVEDTGRGIREEDRDRVFAAFEQIDVLGRSEAYGAGLGLNLSRRLADPEGDRAGGYRGDHRMTVPATFQDSVAYSSISPRRSSSSRDTTFARLLIGPPCPQPTVPFRPTTAGSCDQREST